MDQTVLWTEVGAFAQVAAAVATFAAVCVSLWLARSERRANVKVRAGLRLMFAGDGSAFEDVISIVITNFGMRAVRISSMGWRTGWLRRGPKWLGFQYAVQKLDHRTSMLNSPALPFDLGPGQETTLYLSPDPFRNGGELRGNFFNRHFPWRRKPSPAKICVIVFLVAAKNVVTRAERGLERFLATGVITNGAERANNAANAKV